ncbi:hypothetical protein ACVGW6_00445, partial [Enterobacter intestinihominis]
MVAFRDGEVDKIKHNALLAGENVVACFLKPGVGYGLLVKKLGVVGCVWFRRLFVWVGGGGGVIRCLVMSPFSLL